MEQQDWIDWIGDGIDDVRGQEQPEGLDQLRRDLGSRFSKTRRLAPEEKKAA